MADYIITMMAEALSEETLRQAADAMGTERVEWLEAGKAADIWVDDRHQMTDDGRIISPSVICHLSSVDWIVQPAANRRKKLLIADMDSTMITVECLDELADFVGKKAEVAAITDRAMNGELAFEPALVERVALLKGLPEETLQRCYDERVRFTPGARELVQTMRKAGGRCVLVSGGFTFFTARVAEALGFHAHFSNVLEVENGILTGRVVEPILGKEAKLKTLEDEVKALGISCDDVLAVGDGANDLPMLLAAGLGIAYHAKPAVRTAAKHRIDQCDLRALLWAQGLTDSF